MGFWLENVVIKSKLPYPIFFVALNAALYLGGLAIAAATGNVQPYFAQPRWVIMAVFGTFNGIAIFLVLRLFRRSLASVKPLLMMEPDAWTASQQDLLKQVTYPVYWIPVAFWLAFSFYHSFILGSGWWTIGTVYEQPRIVAAYGYIYQGIAGCLLGGMLMGMLPINLNLAFWKLSSPRMYSDNCVTRKGKSCFRSLKNLIILNTATLVVSTGIAMSLWMEVLPLAPVVGSFAELIPAAVLPNYLFHNLLARSKDKKLGELEGDLADVSGIKENASIRDLIRFEVLSREEEKTRHETTWLVDLHAVIELMAVSLVHVIIIEGLSIFLHF